MDFDFKKDILLENSRALLRPLAISDFDNLIAVALEDKNLLQYSPKPIHSEELLKQYLDNAVAERKNNNRYPFIIFDKQANGYVGSTSFGNVSNIDKRIEIGWTWLGKEFQKTGLNRNCKFLLLSYAFDELEFERVELKTDERNQQSRTAIEKLGATYEGALRSHMVVGDGFRRNTVYYSILRNEWGKMKGNFLKA